MDELDIQEEFAAFNFQEFKRNFLIERDLDKSPRVRLGELSRNLSKINKEIAQKLNSWTAEISSKVNRYIKRIKKRNREADLHIRQIKMGDVNDAASLIAIDIHTLPTIKKGTIQISVFDNNHISVKMSDNIADIVNKGSTEKFMRNKDKVAAFVIGVLERIS